jgi:hypothetical protein
MMGREATCHCQWGSEAGKCKVLLEGPELILRAGIRRRVPLKALRDVSVRGDSLVFRAEGDQVALHLGAEAAARWVEAIAKPRPTLASKLGISSKTKLLVLGQVPSDVRSEELSEAIAQGSVAGKQEPDLILLCIHQRSDLALYNKRATHAPLWIVYPKGAGSGLKESELREFFRGHGLVDTKVASVSAKLTALRFHPRKQ